MPTVERRHGVADIPEYRVFLLDEHGDDARRWQWAGAGSAAVHLLLLLVLIAVPRSDLPPTRERKMAQRVTPLVDPPTRLTQRDANRAPISQELTADSPEPVPERAPRPLTRRPQNASPPPAPPPQTARAHSPAPAVPQEPPKVEARPQQTAQVAPPPAVTPPPRTIEQPKLVLENVPPAASPTAGTGRIKMPGGGVQEAIRELAKSGAGTRAVGDSMDVPPDIGPNRTPLPTRPKSSLELVSDPKGVDFKPYLIEVLQAVRTNWFAVYPESARIGERGRVVVQFAIARDGKITKVVFTTESGARALDRAAVAALSASDPLPQLPADFKGDRVVLQFTFLYNAPR